MKVGDFIYFAPEIRYADLDLSGITLPDQFRARIEGFFLMPAQLCIEQGHAFAAGLLCVAAIDAISRLHFGPNRLHRLVRKDFCSFARLLLPSFADKGRAHVLYENFRNGLVHEARLKNGCQFSLDAPSTLDASGPTPVINPQASDQ